MLTLIKSIKTLLCNLIDCKMNRDMKYYLHTIQQIVRELTHFLNYPTAIYRHVVQTRKG
jgi:hypothetical protein